MTTHFPANNLPDEAQQWRRKIEKEIAHFAATAGRLTAAERAAAAERRALGNAISQANLTREEQQEALAEARRTPAAPENPQVTTDAFFDEYGFPRALVTGSCDLVTLSTLGDEMRPKFYELHGRQSGTDGGAWRKLGESWPISYEGQEIDDAVETWLPTFSVSPLPAGETWDFKFRAVSNADLPGEFSAIITLLLAKDATPPPQPATPVGTSRLGQVSLTWSGKTSGGQTMPPDFSHAEVWIADTNTAAGKAIGKIGIDDTFYAPEQPYNVDRYYWVIAVDYSGNRSLPSARVVVRTKPLVDTDVIGKVIAEANLETAVADKVNKAYTDADQALRDANAAATKAQQGIDAAIQAKADAAAAAGKADTALASANGKNRNFYYATAPTTAADGPFVVGDTWFNTSNGNRISRWSGTAWVAADLGAGALASGSVGATQLATAVNNAIAQAQTTADGKNSVTRSTSAASGPGVNGDQWWRYSGTQVIGFWIYNNGWVQQTLTDAVITNLNAGTITAGTLAADRIAGNSITGDKLVADTISTREMKAGSITAASGIIADAAITNAKIANIDAGKITAGTIDAARIGANTITADKVLIGDMTNFALDIQNAAERAAFPATGQFRYFTSSASAPGMPWVLCLDPGVGYANVPAGQPFAIQPGEQIYMSFMASRRDGDQAVSLNLQTRDADGNIVAQDVRPVTALPTATRNTWITYSGIVTMPADSVVAYPMFKRNSGTEQTGQWYFSKPIIRRVTTGELIVDGAITASKIETGAVTAGKVAANAITADNIAAKAITTDKMIVAAAGNLIPNGGFEDGLTNWRTTSAVTGLVTQSGPNGAATIARIAVPQADYGIASTAYPSGLSAPAYTPGAAYHFRLVARRTSTTAAGAIRIRLGFHGEGQGNEWPVPSGMSMGAADMVQNQWYVIEGTYTTPTNNPRDRMSVSVHFANATGVTFEVAEVAMRLRASGELIVDGAITADKIQANSVNATHIVGKSITSAEIKALTIGAGELAANAITADKIDAGAVTAVKIDGGAITGDKIAGNAIDGKTITGALVRTAPSGDRVEMTTSGIRVVAGGAEQVRLGYGIDTGMSVRDPSSNVLVPLAAHIFGVTAASLSSAWSIAKPASTSTMASPVWSGWTTHEWVSTVTSYSGRIAVWGWARVDNLTTGQNYTVEVELLARRTDTNATVGTVSKSWLGWGNQASLNGQLKDIPVGVPIAFTWRARTQMFTNTGTPQVNERGLFAMPV